MEQDTISTLRIKKRQAVVSGPSVVEWLSQKTQIRWLVFIAGMVTFVCLFWSPLAQLFVQVSRSDLNSHIPLLPFVSAYLLWIRRTELSPSWDYKVKQAIIFASLALGTILFWETRLSQHLVQKESDLLSLKILAFVSLTAALLFFVLGKANSAQAAFPVGFLFLMVPLPETTIKYLTAFLQHASADAAYVLMALSGMPVLREGLVFSLPGLTIEVAEECSGIRSTLVLFITSLLAGHLFLRKPWGKWALAAAVVPIGVMRNGFRILTISWLTVNVDHRVIDSPIHHRGGPFFFILSLLPLLGLLAWLRRCEERANKPIAVKEGLG